jgi:hypothetical protein
MALNALLFGIRKQIRMHFVNLSAFVDETIRLFYI